ncbi:MAG TPA: serine hydrolase domain-containing protein [Bryobacteraceae bacterium]|nr:serine hydrolase domain-containing protein [Bryobacteraceae bacterium]
MDRTWKAALRPVFSVVMIAAPLAAASIQTSKPEDVGLSPERLNRIQQTIQRHIDAHDISGAVTLVARRGRVAHFAADGLMDVDAKKPMSKESLFWIASMTKPITGAAILMLMEEGKIRLTDPVSKFIPELRGLKVAVMEERQGPAGRAAAAAEPQFYTVPASREITIRDLLTHTSGLVSGGPASTFENQKVARKPGEKLADYIPRLAATPLDFQPGTRWSYSPSAGFDTLGRIVEVVSGQAFDQFLRQRIFEPLGMKDTSFHPGGDLLPRIATMYHRNANVLDKVDMSERMNNTTYFSGAGGLMTDAEDYLQFAQMLLNGGAWNGKRFLSPKTIELMSAVHAPDTLPGRPKGRGFGLSVQVVSDAIAANYRVSDGSFGWDGAFGTHFWVDPKEKVVGIMMIQTNNPNRELDRDFENAVMQAMVD